MMPSPRPRSTRQALAGLQYAFGTVARPNALVFVWRWRYELILGVGLPALLIALGGMPVMLSTLGGIAMVAGAAFLWPPARRYLIARAWCIITPHRVRVGCAMAWIHSRRGKIPIVLLTRRQPFGERVHLWCRAGTSEVDFTSALPLLIAACWARDMRVTGNERFAHLVTLDVIRRVPPGQPGVTGIGRRIGRVPAARTPPDGSDDQPTQPFPGREDLGPAA
jgi:hypothetical protein